uniref:HTH myb-type domain-containing protein n=1 Tax=Setaria viridis TaxID=4556 RepID=A0A4U6STZ7_SETVI|nr:hypothetical protein SEVIR_9G151200v2 [Setaria viridis]
MSSLSQQSASVSSPIFRLGIFQCPSGPQPTLKRIMSKNKPTQKNDVSDMSSMLASHIICAMLPARSFLRWSDDLHMIFVKAVAYQGGPHEAKSTALKETMEAMGVVGLTIQNIKSHLQRYREKCELSAEAPVDEVPGTTSLSKAALNQASKILWTMMQLCRKWR